MAATAGLEAIDDDAAARNRLWTADAAARLLVDAGPGTGKTQAAARRIVHLVSIGLSPSQILVLSFSRSAVRTLTRRMTAVVGVEERVVEDLRHVSVRTFDSWAFRILRLLGGQPEDLLRRRHDDNVEALVGLLRGPSRDDVRQVLGDRRHLVVDEFQDLPGVRGELVLALMDLLAPLGGGGCGFTVLGDPAQAIYGFAAAGDRDAVSAAAYWRRIVERYGDGIEHLRLTHNFRSTPPIAAMSARLRAVLTGDLKNEEKLRAVQEALAALPKSEGFDLASITGGGSSAVLTRTNGEALRVLTGLMGRELEGAGRLRMRAASFATLPPAWIAGLLRRVPTGSVARSQFDRIHAHLSGAWGPSLCAELALPAADVAWGRIALASGVAADATSLELAMLRARLGWHDAFPDDQPLLEDGVVITTIHQSKGAEFDAVTILETAPDRLPDDGDHAEEAHVGYVAMTRAGSSLARASADVIYRPPTGWTFRNDRTRLCSWWNGWINLEMGQNGDVDPLSFVDPALHGPGGPAALQEYLLANAESLAGRKVILCKYLDADQHATWRIHLQIKEGPGMLLGATTPQLTFDLLHVLNKKGYTLPHRIFNLRISGVGTITSDADARLEVPESSSRLWLGVSLFGTGDFRPSKWKGR
ncbi:UvrD-helicase domain-containing protein [Methylobacterium sp. Leaf117]|uniref:UvrD-helicase domain-containing protein n=1 Tax=Methylobacterium sp. Leaf117 TaxID=1736260 RepID=UPI000AC6E16A|nr:UvrD-helicase domain-containing protein [Methylobacterium sp. Leaf117]